MTIYVLFGVKSSDIETARRWVEECLALSGIARTNNYNGDYYTFEDPAGPEFKVIKGVCSDEDGTYLPEPEFSDWKVLLYADDLPSPAHQIEVLEKQSDRFVKLRSEMI